MMMTPMFKLRIIPLVFGLIPAVATAYEAKPTIVVGDIGLHCPYEVLASEPAPDTEIGAIDVIVGEPSVLSATTTVPAVQHLGFGFQARLADGIKLPGAEIVVRHPPMGTEGVTEQRWTPSLSDQDFSLGMYRFDMPYEVLIGEWSFAIEQAGQTHFSVTFDVIPAPAGMSIESLCSGDLLLS